MEMQGRAREGVDGRWQPGLGGERDARLGFGAGVVAVLLERKRMHRAHRGVAREVRAPVPQGARDAALHPCATARVEVERLRDEERDEIARILVDDRAVDRRGSSLRAGEPGPCGVGMGPLAPGRAGAERVDAGDRLGEVTGARFVPPDDQERRTQRMPHREAAVPREAALDLGERIAVRADVARERALEGVVGILAGSRERESPDVCGSHGRSRSIVARTPVSAQTARRE